MRTTAGLSTLCLCLLLIGYASAAQAMEVNINFLLGAKSLDEDDWGQSVTREAAETQLAIGVETTFGGTSWPVAIAVDSISSLHYASRGTSLSDAFQQELVVGTQEFDFGVRKIWKGGSTRPFVGGGLGFMTAYQQIDISIGGQYARVNDAETTLGFWVNGGMFWRLGPKFNIGVDLRLSAGKADLFGQDVQVGGATLGMIIGWGWGGG